MSKITKLCVNLLQLRREKCTLFFRTRCI